MKSKKIFEEPLLNVIEFEATDIITTSGEDPKFENALTPELDGMDIVC